MPHVTYSSGSRQMVLAAGGGVADALSCSPVVAEILALQLFQGVVGRGWERKRAPPFLRCQFTGPVTRRVYLHHRPARAAQLRSLPRPSRARLRAKAPADRPASGSRHAGTQVVSRRHSASKMSGFAPQCLPCVPRCACASPCAGDAGSSGQVQREMCAARLAYMLTAAADRGICYATVRTGRRHHIELVLCVEPPGCGRGDLMRNRP